MSNTDWANLILWSGVLVLTVIFRPKIQWWLYALAVLLIVLFYADKVFNAL